MDTCYSTRIRVIQKEKRATNVLSNVIPCYPMRERVNQCKNRVIHCEKCAIQRNKRYIRREIQTEKNGHYKKNIF